MIWHMAITVSSCSDANFSTLKTPRNAKERAMKHLNFAHWMFGDFSTLWESFPYGVAPVLSKCWLLTVLPHITSCSYEWLA